MCDISRKNPHLPHGRSLENILSGQGSQKLLFFFKEIMLLNWNSRGWVGPTQTSFCGRGMDISWNNTIQPGCTIHLLILEKVWQKLTAIRQESQTVERMENASFTSWIFLSMHCGRLNRNLNLCKTFSAFLVLSASSLRNNTSWNKPSAFLLAPIRR